MGSLTPSPLYSSPSFLKGMARSVALFGKFDNYNQSSSEAEADYKATKRDWKIVGAQLYQGILTYGKNTKVKKAK